MAAATSLATLAQSLLTEPTPAQEVRTLLGSTTAAPTSAPANTAVPVDRFVPSSQSATGNATAEAAGLFTASQFSPSRSTSSQVTLFTSAAGALPTPTNPAPSTATTVPAPGSATTEQQLQSLNSSLAALGLSAADIKKVDQIASVIGNFSPTSFTSLVYQLEGLAAAASQATAQPSIAKTAVNARASTTEATATSGAGNAATPTAGNSTGDKSAPQGLQLQLTFANNTGEIRGGQAVGVTANLAPAQKSAATA